MPKKLFGFSLLEVLLVVAILVLLVVIVAPSYRGFAKSSDLSVAVNVLAQSLNHAQELARSGSEDSDWGVYVEPGRVIVFKGSDFESRDVYEDNVFIVASDLSVGGPNEVVFSKFTGKPQQITPLEIILVSVISEIETITVNAQGAVSY